MSAAIEQLIPHRAPMRWVDELIDCTDTTATATTRFTAEHFAVAHPHDASSLSSPKGGEGRGENSPNQSSRCEPLNAAERRSPDRLVAHQVWNRADQEIGAPVHGEEAQLFSDKIPSPQPSPRLGGERESGTVIETALVECMAQTVAAALGQRLRASGKSGAANHGMLAAVANFKIHHPPPLDQTLTIEVREVKRLGPMLLITGKISCGTELIATGDLSLYA